MAIAPGARIGIYEVVSLIGSGGMGEVYLARDTQLGRNVALKVLPDMFASDAERLARFRREAQVLAALHHPNIAVIHGLEDGPAEAGPHVRALVLEYIEGDTLADRIAAERIPLDEALGIARQIAEALQSAHDQGVIHRDLKPSNIKITPDGTVKVLDFGLAKLASPAEAASGAGSSVTMSPTITSPAATTLGVILGTAAYMPPEQAKGKTVDKRSDVWAFGCVLFEMLTAKRAFEGDDISDTLASVLKGEPEWSALPADVPPPIRTLLRSCLTKGPRARLADMAGALFVLQNHGTLAERGVGADVRAVPTRRLTWRIALASVIAIAAAAAISAWVGWRMKPEDPLRSLVTTFRITLPEGESFPTSEGRHLVAASPDSRALVYVAANRLNLRRTGELDVVALRGTEGQTTRAPRGPFFSPNSQWIGFWAGNQLQKISVNDGAAQMIAEVSVDEQTGGGHWTGENTIVFSGATGIWRVSADSGKPELLIKADDRRLHHPQLLPGGRALLYTSLPRNRSTWDRADVIVRTLADGAERRIAGGADGRYLPTGHVVFVVRGVLMAVAFDTETLTTFGGPIPLGEEIVEAQAGAAHFDVSAAGTLVYVASAAALAGSTPIWIDRQGREAPLGADSRPYLYLRLAPDESRVAFDIGSGPGRDIWMWDVAQRAMRPLTTGPEADRSPVFTLNSQRIIFTSTLGGAASPTVFSQSADGVGSAEPLTSDVGTSAAITASSIAPDGTILLRGATGDSGAIGIYALPPGRDGKVTRLIDLEFAEQNADISHDGRWIAYQTNKSGRHEIVVRPYPAINAETSVSVAGGTEPLWSADDKELFFRSPDGAIMHVVVTSGSSNVWSAKGPVQVLPGTGLRVGTDRNPLRTYDVSKDGRRFLVLKNNPAPERTSTAPKNIIVVQKWFEELKRRVPVK